MLRLSLLLHTKEHLLHSLPVFIEGYARLRALRAVVLSFFLDFNELHRGHHHIG